MKNGQKVAKWTTKMHIYSEGNKNVYNYKFKF